MSTSSKFFVAIPFLLFGITAQADSVKPGDHVPLLDWNFNVQGSGVSLDEFVNSLTDVNGLLENFTVKSSGHVHLDQGKPQVNGAHISIPFTYTEILHFHSISGSTLSASSSVQCDAGEKGKTLLLTSDPPTPQNKDITTSQIVFQICAKATANNSLQVHVSTYLVAGPQWRSQAIDAAQVLFADLPDDIQTHAVHYATSLDEPGQDQTVATSGVANH